MKTILSPFYKIARAVRRLHELRTMPLRLEFVVTDYCNLNCRGCTHYSPLAAKEFTPIESLRRNMAHLGRVCGTDVESVYLIGGETLLYPDIIAAMEALRESFATQKLYIFTNGLMIPRLDDAFWATAARLDIILAITRYPIRFDYDAAIALCASKGVRTEVFGDRSMKDSFYRFALDPAKKQNKRIAHFKCFNRGCVSILGERLYPCSISACVGHLNKACGTDFRHTEADSLKVDEIKSAAEIRRLRDNPVPFCGYCRAPQTVPYAPSKRQVSEWVE